MPPCSCPTHEFNEGFAPCGSIEQFTGSLDKNGKEIFEGDIVRYFHRSKNLGSIANPEEEIFIRGVEFSFGAFRLTGYPASEDTIDSCEVIGNTYENPDVT